MSRRLLRLEVPVFPERLMFRIHDPGAELDAPSGPSQPVDSLISTSRDQLIVACAQQHLGVQLTVEEWDAAPPPFSDGYEDEAKCVLYLRGRSSVWTWARLAGPSRRCGCRAGSVTTGCGSTRGTGRRPCDSYTDLYQQFADPLSDEFQQARKELEGMEQYLLQLWRES